MTQEQKDELKRQYNLETYGSMAQYDRNKLWDWFLSEIEQREALIHVCRKIKLLPHNGHEEFSDRMALVTQQTVCQEIKVVFIRVVEFIKWYNQQEK